MSDSKVTKTDEEWRAQLGGEAFHITREAGTERAFTGKFYEHEQSGNYHCVCCDAPLFASEGKFNSGCGWPSFFEAMDDKAVLRRSDESHGMKRVEIVCARCDAHLGHVFNDGPKPTGERFCVNSRSLSFEGETD